MPLQILVDEEKCIGCGKCAEICPKAALKLYVRVKKPKLLKLKLIILQVRL